MITPLPHLKQIIFLHLHIKEEYYGILTSSRDLSGTICQKFKSHKRKKKYKNSSSFLGIINKTNSFFTPSHGALPLIDSPWETAQKREKSILLRLNFQRELGDGNLCPFYYFSSFLGENTFFSSFDIDVRIIVAVIIIIISPDEKMK